jgi:adhesin transport system membrane fusion protein
MNKIKEFLNSPEVNRLKEIFKLFNNNDNLKLPKTPLNKNDYEYMKSLSAAVVFSSSKKLHWVLISFCITIFLFITWAAFAEIDEIARGSGKVVPNGQNQIVQNLEGGIVQEILVKEGDIVEKDQVLVRISNEKGTSTAMSNEIKSYYLQAQIKRLEAELKRAPFEYTKGENEELNEFLDNENELYITNQKQHRSIQNNCTTTPHHLEIIKSSLTK